MDEAKSSRQAVGAQALTELAGFAAPTLLALGSRLIFRFPQPVMQTATTNVPGPRAPLYLLSRRMVEIHPYVPIGNNIRTSIGVLSYLDQLNFGINADFDAVPDIGVLTAGIRAGIHELLASVGRTPSPTPPPTAVPMAEDGGKADGAKPDGAKAAAAKRDAGKPAAPRKRTTRRSPSTSTGSTPATTRRPAP
jgi:hypothetical protein